MTNENTIKTFDELSEYFRTYIVKYISYQFNSPVYLVWYTDTDKEETDKFITDKRKTIFASAEINNILKAITECKNNLHYSENLEKWLTNGAKLNPIENCVFDIDKLESNIFNNILTLDTLSSFVDFINIVGDYSAQIDHTLQDLIRTEPIDKVWDFFYDEYFWTKPDNSVNQELKVDHLTLLKDFQKLRTKFESCIELYETHSH
jgi:hypothetical protein